ncbi:homocysteine S-methyltransferase family protein [bacterium]|nr:homocysteine S-methyltransferase family protein [bacterium]
MTFSDRLSQSSIIILDGATGSELEARGVKTLLPLWSTVALLSREGRKTLRSIHRDYIHAGAEIITANTFRTNYRALKKESMESRAFELTRIAVDEVRFAREESKVTSPVLIAGSVAPVEDCYSPELVPASEELLDEHRRHIDNLYNSGVDVILIETMNTIREAVIALEYAKQTELPVLVSFICKDPEHLLSGESLEKAVESIAVLKPDVILINCVDVNLIEGNLEALRSLTSLPIGGYANVLKKGHTTESDITPQDYAKRVEDWINRFQMKVVGGCCGTTPKHIQYLKEA